MFLKLPPTQQVPAADKVDDVPELKVGNVYLDRRRGRARKLLLVYRLTPQSAHILKFDLETGAFTGVGNPRRFVLAYDELVGFVPDLPQQIGFDVKWLACIAPRCIKGVCGHCPCGNAPPVPQCQCSFCKEQNHGNEKSCAGT